ncbi:hypothetical protein TGPRC2_283760 [Toxoplasma gondii TgCatPRC2]|uniref:Uncharacterized protein n=1 Tax=Toxoplasma gondii TgCatPRC2 TaxID=1130821 RepID=A0A151H1A9_TOXGO|nr:hypothetical protein TGPRC2_283760 [Toxoplasma gondii TgCatPRC2]
MERRTRNSGNLDALRRLLFGCSASASTSAFPNKRDEQERILFVTGAGLSVGCGIPLYRRESDEESGRHRSRRRTARSGKLGRSRGTSAKDAEGMEADFSRGEARNDAVSAHSETPPCVWRGDDASEEMARGKKRDRGGQGDERLRKTGTKRTRGSAAETWGLLSTFLQEREQWFSAFWFRAHDPRLFRRAFPSAGHFVLAFLLLSRPATVLLFTQNVDRMHHVARSILRDALKTQVAQKALERETHLQTANGEAAAQRQAAEEKQRQKEGDSEKGKQGAGEREKRRQAEQEETADASLRRSRVREEMWRGLAAKGGWWRMSETCSVDGQLKEGEEEKNLYELHGSMYSYRCSGVLPSSRVLASTAGHKERFGVGVARGGGTERERRENEKWTASCASSPNSQATEKQQRMLAPPEVEREGALCPFRFRLSLDETQVVWCPYTPDETGPGSRRKVAFGERSGGSEEARNTREQTRSNVEACGGDSLLRASGEPGAPDAAVGPAGLSPQSGASVVDASPFLPSSSLSVLPAFSSLAGRASPSSKAGGDSDFLLLPLCPACSSLCLPMCLWFDESLFLPPHSAFESPAALRHAFLFLGGVKRLAGGGNEMERGLEEDANDAEKTRKDSAAARLRDSSRSSLPSAGKAKLESNVELRNATAGPDTNPRESSYGESDVEVASEEGKTAPEKTCSSSRKTQRNQDLETQTRVPATRVSPVSSPVSCVSPALSVDPRDRLPSLVFVGTSFSTASTDWPALLHAHAVKVRRLFRSKKLGKEAQQGGERAGESFEGGTAGVGVDSGKPGDEGRPGGSSDTPRTQQRLGKHRSACEKKKEDDRNEPDGQVFCINSGSCLDASYEATERQKMFLDSWFTELFENAVGRRDRAGESLAPGAERRGGEVEKRLRSRAEGGARGSECGVKREQEERVHERGKSEERIGRKESREQEASNSYAALETTAEEETSAVDARSQLSLSADGFSFSCTASDEHAGPEESHAAEKGTSTESSQTVRLHESARFDSLSPSSFVVSSSSSSCSRSLSASAASAASSFSSSTSPCSSSVSLSSLASRLFPALPAEFAAAGSAARGSVLEITSLPRMRRIVGDASEVLLSLCPCELRHWLLEVREKAFVEFLRLVEQTETL